MLKSQIKIKQLKKEKYKVPKKVQDLIPFDILYKDGTFQKGTKSTGNKFSKTFSFTDINFKNASLAQREGYLLQYVNILTSMDTMTLIKITINNRTKDIEKFSEETLVPHKKDEWDIYTNDYNSMILSNTAKKNNIEQDHYLTLTIFRDNYEDARFIFSRLFTDLKNQFEDMGSTLTELDASERLRIFHDFYRGNDKEFNLDFEDLSKKGYSFKDTITPSNPKFKNKYFKFDEKYGRVLYLKDFPNNLSDTFIGDLCDFNKNMVYSFDLMLLPPDEGRKEIQNKLDGVEKNITDYQRRQNINNNFSAMIPLQMENQRDELRSVLNELTNADQRLMLGNISLVHLADSKEELDNDTEHIRSFGSSHGCEFETLFPSTRQLSGLYTVLPYFDNYLMNQRTLLSLSVGAFIPFRSQEIMQKGGIWYGQNKITNNPIICNKTALKNCNSLTFGVPGSGKSFLTKEEIEFLILGTNDELIICDPEGEYTPIVEAFGGEVINITAKGKDHINAMDMFHGYGNDGNSIADKSQFIMSLFEELDTRHEGISANDRSIIDRCVQMVYEKAFEENKTPVLMDLYNMLCEQPDKEAKDLATRIEICARGSFDTFGYPTNVDINNRIVSFNLRNLQKQQKPIGLLVVTDAIINRVNENWRNHKKTHVFIDEIHVIFEHKESAAFFSSAWRQFRKRDAYPTGITQNVSFLLTSNEGRDIVSNTEFFVMLSQAEPDQVRIAELLKIPAEQMQHVNNAPAGTGLIKFGPTIIPFVNQMPKGPLYSLNTTNPNDEESAFRKS